jgi:biopolymer transport protein ExbB
MDTTLTLPAVVDTTQSLNLWDVGVKGGWMMIPILIASLIAVYLFVDKIIFLRRARIDTENFRMNMRAIILEGKLDAALALASRTAGPIAAILKAGLSHYREGRESVKESVSMAARQEIYHIEKNLGAMASIAGVSPLLGFLGTVTGMIKAFMRVQALQGNANPSELAGGIWEALVTTAAGLVVGIIALLFYNYLISRAEHFVHEIEDSSNELLDLLRQSEDIGGQQR